MGTKEKEWQTTTNRFVAFFDIMGFKDRLKEKGHDFVLKELWDIKATKEAFIENFPYIPETNLKSFQFSDSFFIFTKSDSPADFLDLLYRTVPLLRFSLLSKIPLKGAISYGHITADFKNSLFVGQPIIDAYLLHEELHMFGAILDHHAEAQISELRKTVDKSYLKELIIQYKAPTKNGKITHYCINWPEIILKFPKNPTSNAEGFDYRLTFGNKRLLEGFYETVSGKPRMYVDNTLAFYDFTIEEAKKDYPGIEEFKIKKTAK